MFERFLEGGGRRREAGERVNRFWPADEGVPR